MSFGSILKSKNKKVSKSKRALLVVAGVILMLIAVINSPRVSEIRNFPGFELATVEGAAISYEDFESKPMVISVWAPWCSYCINELVKISELEKEYGDVSFVTITQGSAKDSDSFMDSLGLKGKLLTLVDDKGDFYSSIKARGLPLTIFVYPDGRFFSYEVPLGIDVMRANMDLISEG